jgi:hypothetical protein
MPSKIVKSVRSLASYTKQSKSRQTTILTGQGEPGHRAAPARGTVQDANIEGCLDIGEIVKKDNKEFRRYKFQLNVDAGDSTLKKLAAQDSHKVWSTADVEIKKDRTDEEANQAIDDFAAQLERNLAK